MAKILVLALSVVGCIPRPVERERPQALPRLTRAIEWLKEMGIARLTIDQLD